MHVAMAMASMNAWAHLCIVSPNCVHWMTNCQRIVSTLLSLVCAGGRGERGVGLLRACEEGINNVVLAVM